MKSILDPSFQYTPSIETDVRKTFARIRRELKSALVRRSQRGSADACTRLSRLTRVVAAAA